jgi:hypothetical protein
MTKQEISEQLKQLAPKWSYQDRLAWSTANGYNVEYIRKTYLKGKVANNIVGLNIINEIKSKL